MLAVEQLTLRFGGVTALDGITFTVEAGERVALVGPNGAGKTSVLNCISGVQRPSAGRILVDGYELLGARAWGRAALGVARTLQATAVVDDLTVLDNLLLGRHQRMRTGVVAAALRLPRARREEAAHAARCRQVAASLGLEDELGRRAAGLPFGARKRIELGRALAQEPRLLLLDEPFAGVTSGEADLMVAAVRAATGDGRGAALVVDHRLATLARLVDRTVQLDAGRVVAAAPA